MRKMKTISEAVWEEMQMRVNDFITLNDRLSEALGEKKFEIDHLKGQIDKLESNNKQLEELIKVIEQNHKKEVENLLKECESQNSYARSAALDMEKMRIQMEAWRKKSKDQQEKNEGIINKDLQIELLTEQLADIRAKEKQKEVDLNTLIEELQKCVSSQEQDIERLKEKEKLIIQKTTIDQETQTQPHLSYPTNSGIHNMNGEQNQQRHRKNTLKSGTEDKLLQTPIKNMNDEDSSAFCDVNLMESDVQEASSEESQYSNRQTDDTKGMLPPMKATVKVKLRLEKLQHKQGEKISDNSQEQRRSSLSPNNVNFKIERPNLKIALSEFQDEAVEKKEINSFRCQVHHRKLVSSIMLSHDSLQDSGTTHQNNISNQTDIKDFSFKTKFANENTNNQPQKLYLHSNSQVKLDFSLDVINEQQQKTKEVKIPPFTDEIQYFDKQLISNQLSTPTIGKQQANILFLGNGLNCNTPQQSQGVNFSHSTIQGSQNTNNSIKQEKNNYHANPSDIFSKQSNTSHPVSHRTSEDSQIPMNIALKQNAINKQQDNIKNNSKQFELANYNQETPLEDKYHVEEPLPTEDKLIEKRDQGEKPNNNKNLKMNCKSEQQYNINIIQQSPQNVKQEQQQNKNTIDDSWNQQNPKFNSINNTLNKATTFGSDQVIKPPLIISTFTSNENSSGNNHNNGDQHQHQKQEYMSDYVDVNLMLSSDEDIQPTKRYSEIEAKMIHSEYEEQDTHGVKHQQQHKHPHNHNHHHNNIKINSKNSSLHKEKNLGGGGHEIRTIFKSEIQYEVEVNYYLSIEGKGK